VIHDQRLGLAGRYVATEIADTGSGIPQDILPRVFEPFVTTKGIGAGAGLGLSQVHGFAHQSEGAVAIESEPGKGTTVRLYLRATTKQLAPVTAAPREAGPYSGKGTILIVEDQTDLADLAAELFGQWPPEIKIVHRANAALELLRAGEKFDLVFSDIMMPDGIDGLELAEVMKTQHPGIPILLTTGYSDIAAAAIAKGFHVIPKPYRMEELRMRLRALLGTLPT